MGSFLDKLLTYKLLRKKKLEIRKMFSIILENISSFLGAYSTASDQNRNAFAKVFEIRVARRPLGGFEHSERQRSDKWRARARTSHGREFDAAIESCQKNQRYKERRLPVGLRLSDTRFRSFRHLCGGEAQKGAQETERYCRENYRGGADEGVARNARGEVVFQRCDKEAVRNQDKDCIFL